MLVEYLTRRWESRPINVFGTGTSLDSWRLRELLAVELGVHPGNVHAWVIGEHGDSAVFPFEAVRIGPFSLAEFGRLAGRPLGAERLAEIEQQVRAAAYEVRALKGSNDTCDRTRDCRADPTCGPGRGQDRAGQHPCRTWRLRQPSRTDPR